jgi:hypothetical protein
VQNDRRGHLNKVGNSNHAIPGRLDKAIRRCGATRASIFLRKKFLRRSLDCLVKPGNDGEERWIAKSPGNDGVGGRAISLRALFDPRRLERNPKVQEMTAGPVSLLLDCYLQ